MVSDVGEQAHHMVCHTGQQPWAPAGLAGEDLPVASDTA